MYSGPVDKIVSGREEYLELLEYIESNTLEKLMEYNELERWKFMRYGYKQFKINMDRYFLGEDDTIRYLYHNFIRKLGVDPYHDIFSEPRFPASYPSDGCNEPTFFNAIVNLKNNINVFKNISFNDDMSYFLYNVQIKYRLFGNKNVLFDRYDKREYQYFDPDIISLKEEGEVFVDCGAYVGDTLLALSKRCNIKSTKIYAFEPNAENYNTMKSKWGGQGIIMINKAVGDKDEKLLIQGEGNMANISNTGDCIESTSLDNAIKEKVTFIKMDIEGYELAALKGAENHIRSDRPILAISAYHKLEDLYLLQNYISRLVNNYKYYFRHYGKDVPESVLYCIPNERV